MCSNRESDNHKKSLVLSQNWHSRRYMSKIFNVRLKQANMRLVNSNFFHILFKLLLEKYNSVENDWNLIEYRFKKLQFSRPLSASPTGSYTLKMIDLSFHAFKHDDAIVNTRCNREKIGSNISTKRSWLLFKTVLKRSKDNFLNDNNND